MGEVGERVKESGGALASVWHNRGLRRVSLAFLGSMVGDWAFVTGVAVYVYQRSGPGTLGALVATRFVLLAVVGPFAAMLADRYDRRTIMVASDLLRVVLVVAGAVLVFTDGPRVVVYVLYVCTAVAGTAFRPAQGAIMPNLANNPAELTAANVVSSTIHSVGFLAGPAVAGLLLALSGVGAVYVFNAASFLWSAVLALGLHTQRPTAVDATDGDGNAVNETWLQEAAAGFSTILRHRDLRRIMSLYVAQTIVAGCANVFEVVVAIRLLHTKPAGVGLLGSATGVGGLLGGAVALLLARRGAVARNFGVGVAMWAAPLLLIAVWPNMVVTLAAMALVGIGNSLVDVNFETIVQRLAPDAVLGRVFGAMDSAAVAGMSVGAALMPLLIDQLGIRRALVVVGTVILAIVVVMVGELAHIDRVALAPEGLEALRAVPMLGMLPDRVLERLARATEVFHVPAGGTVFHEGDLGDRFYVIEDGTAIVLGEGVHLASIGPRDSFGEVALLRNVPRTATVRASTDLTLRAIDRRHFIPAVTGHAAASEQAELVVGRFIGTA